MTFEEKLQVAELLDEMGVDVIEAGFPIASEGDFEAVTEIAKLAKHSVICGLARANFADIDRAGEAIKHARRGRIHTFIGTSPLHRQHQLQLNQEQVYERVVASVTRARGYTDDVEWSAMDATRTEHDYLCRVVEAAIKAGATTINIPDTVGYALPEEYFELISMLKNRVPGMEKVIISTHCHDDLGLGGRQLAGWRSRWCAADRMHDQRSWRAGRQRRARRSRDGHSHAPRSAAVSHGHQNRDAGAGVEAGVGGDEFPGPVQQGDRRPECVRARKRHPPGRRFEEHRDLRDHDAGIGWRR